MRELRADRDRLKTELDLSATRRLLEVEHAAWHVCESSEDRVTENEIVVQREDFEKLSALLPEDHPGNGLSSKPNASDEARGSCRLQPDVGRPNQEEA